METQHPTFSTVKQFARKHSDAFSEGSLRWLIFSNPDFVKTAVRRLGRKVIINDGAALNWLDSKRA